MHPNKQYSTLTVTTKHLKCTQHMLVLVLCRNSCLLDDRKADLQQYQDGEVVVALANVANNSDRQVKPTAACVDRKCNPQKG